MSDFLRPNEAEAVREATTAEEMRAEIFRLSYRNPLVRACWTAADVKGSSAEDRFTLLAYSAIKSLNEIQHKYINFLNITAVQKLVQKEAPALASIAPAATETIAPTMAEQLADEHRTGLDAVDLPEDWEPGQ